MFFESKTLGRFLPRRKRLASSARDCLRMRSRRKYLLQTTSSSELRAASAAERLRYKRRFPKQKNQRVFVQKVCVAFLYNPRANCPTKISGRVNPGARAVPRYRARRMPATAAPPINQTGCTLENFLRRSKSTASKRTQRHSKREEASLCCHASELMSVV